MPSVKLPPAHHLPYNGWWWWWWVEWDMFRHIWWSKYVYRSSCRIYQKTCGRYSSQNHHQNVSQPEVAGGKNHLRWSEILLCCLQHAAYHHEHGQIQGCIPQCAQRRRLSSIFTTLKDFKFSFLVLRTFFTCNNERILMESITARFGNSTKQDKQALKGVVGSAEHTICTELPNLWPIYSKHFHSLKAIRRSFFPCLIRKL